MKKLLLMGLAVSFGLFAVAQQHRVATPKKLADIGIERPAVFSVDNPDHFTTKKANPSVKAGLAPDETDIGETRYDLQTNACTQNRIYFFEDGTVGATWTFGMQDVGGGFADRGTGYNYFDGTSWGPYPTTRIENIRTGWPSYNPWGDGEVVLAHSGGSGLTLASRNTKGTGTWNNAIVPYLPNNDLYWPRMITGGTNHNTIHYIAVTEPVANGGTAYNGQNGAIVYSRSTDGGVTWNPQNIVLPGLDSAYYTGFGGDSYAFGDAKGDTIAFLIGDSWTDLILMKSNDNGTTWTKTVIWENPYPKFDPSNLVATDTFYCPDGAFHLAFDSEGIAHVVFGVNRAHSDGSGTFWFPFVDGVAYWNETMPPFTSSNFKYTLNPDSLYNSGHLIGWTQDLNGNDTLDYLPGSTDILGLYYVSTTSMPQITIDENDDIYVIMASVTESYDNGIQMFRKLWGRAKFSNQPDWGEFVHLTASIIHNFDESVFPSLASNSDNSIHYVYQADEEPGLHIRGDEDPPTDNTIIYAATPKADFGVGISEVERNISFVSQNHPNPFSQTSDVIVSLLKGTTLSLEVFDITGKKVAGVNKGKVGAGYHTITIDGSKLNNGIYFYTVHAGNQSVTKKMIVQ